MTITPTVNIEHFDGDPSINITSEIDYAFRQYKRKNVNNHNTEQVIIIVHHKGRALLHLGYFNQDKANKYFSNKFEKK